MLLTLSQVADRLGISRQTIYNRLSDKKTKGATVRELGAVRIFGRWRFDSEKIETVLKNGTQPYTRLDSRKDRKGSFILIPKRLGPIATVLTRTRARRSLARILAGRAR